MNTSRSARTELIIGQDGLDRMGSARAVVAGAGAVGGYAFEALVRVGIGHIRVIDGDSIVESNLNRQILATYDTIGRPKAVLAKERALSINPTIDVDSVECLITKDTDFQELIGRPDILIDAIDTIGNKTALLRYASENNIRTFSSMGAALHMDTTAIHIATLNRTRVCPLASALRSNLRDVNTSNITCVYSEEQPVVTPTMKDERGKSVLGSLPTVPAIFGMTLANEAIKFIISK
ncbi:MAG: ThiF family adenylyltransferase [Candidatus Methanogranum gryphiswaldense]|nr:MAG: ThiF family adenylyltransferase [Candidatus Methanogranum sp. U3.2.1]